MAEKKKETNKLKARLPRGLADRGAAEIPATRQMIETIRQVYERYGFEPVETPAIEYTDALGKFLPDQDRPNEGVFSFQDDDEQWLSLRYDLTAPLARYVAENFDSLPKPYRSYRVGWVFRNEKPGPGRFRQFMQFDADTVGSSSPAADAEMCMMAADTMEELGIPRGSYVVKVNSRRILDGLLETASIPPEKALQVFRAIDKRDRVGDEGVRSLLGQGRMDESGDFTKGAALDDTQIALLECLWRPFTIPGVKFVTSSSGGSAFYATGSAHDAGESRDMEQTGPFEFIDNLKTLESWETVFSQSPISLKAIQELREIIWLCQAANFGSRRIRVDASVVRGLEYYTGPVFELELTFEATSSDGRPVRFGSVGGGGRYDGLVSRFRPEPVPATGFSVGVSRLAAALHHLGKLNSGPNAGPVVVGVFSDRDPERARDNLLTAQQMVQALRKVGIRAEVYLGNPKNIPNQFKYANRRNSPCVVIQGPDEKARGQVIVRDMILGAELSNFEKDRVQYLQRLSEAQRFEPEGGLVKAVREVLARHGLHRADTHS
jgi:histidyl-tRNA synthetase